MRKVKNKITVTWIAEMEIQDNDPFIGDFTENEQLEQLKNETRERIIEELELNDKCVVEKNIDIDIWIE